MNAPSKEEFELMRSAILLPILLKKLERNIKELEISGYLLKRLYVSVTAIFWQRVRADLEHINSELRANKIRIFEGTHNELCLVYKYNCRGYSDEFSVTRDLVKENLARKLGEYTQKLTKEMQNK
jgi:hypothetical protein